MSSSERRPVANRLLRALPPADYERVRPHLHPVEVRRGDVVIRSREIFRHAYFPEGGLSSVLFPQVEGRRLEVGLSGREGMVSHALALGGDRTPLETLVQVGGTWLRIEADVLRRLTTELPALRDVLLRYVQFFLLTVSQTAVSNGAYRIEERLARWLLISHDRLAGDDLALTHEFLSLMLGTHRPGVTIALHILEGAGMIRAKRGLITVLDRGKLREAAGDSYGTAEAEYERLIGPFRAEQRPAGSMRLVPEAG